jgi:hypothetical protein
VSREIRSFSAPTKVSSAVVTHGSRITSEQTTHGIAVVLSGTGANDAIIQTTAVVVLNGRGPDTCDRVLARDANTRRSALPQD